LVQFLDGSTLIGSRSIDGSGDAELSVNSLTEGTHQITAVYQGSNLFEGSTSNAVAQQVDAAPNVAPSVGNDSYTAFEDQAFTATASVLANDDDPDDRPSPLIARNASDPANGSVTLNSDGTFTYTPDPGYNGNDSFTYEAFDGAAATTGTVTIAVTPVNDAPSFTPGGDVTASVTAPYDQPWASDIKAGPTDESGQAVNFVVTIGALDAAKFSAGPAVSADGRLSFTPSVLASGTVSVSIHIHDDGGTQNGGVDTGPDQQFTITFTP
jgi:VCBS repeat-containing protein